MNRRKSIREVSDNKGHRNELEKLDLVQVEDDDENSSSGSSVPTPD